MEFNVIDQLAHLPLDDIRRIQEKATEILRSNSGTKKVRSCGACGGIGHNKSNKACPRFAETQRKRKREKEKELERKKEKEERKRAKKRERESGESVFVVDFDQYRYRCHDSANENVVIWDGVGDDGPGGPGGESGGDGGEVDAHQGNDGLQHEGVYFQESKLDEAQSLYLKTNNPNGCAICLQNFKTNEDVVRMNCLCVYHSDCAYAWWDSSQKTSCPSHPYLSSAMSE